MSDINIPNSINISASPPLRGKEDNSLNIAAHTTDNMKLGRPNVGSISVPQILNNNNKYSYAESKKHLNALSNDIYQNTKKEKSSHEFNIKRYFTIFGILTALTAIFAYLRRK